MKPFISDPKRAEEYFERRLRFTTGPVELNHWIQDNEDVNVIDVRRAEDFEQGHIPKAKSLPKEKWDSLEGLAKDKLNVLYCYSHVCHLAPTAALQFARKGYPVMELEGGFEEWKTNSLPVEAALVGRS